MTSVATVCILTAGKGSRMGSYAQGINKALLPIKQKAVISYIIEKFPAGTEFVIGLGHLAQQVRTYLTLAHADRTFHFVDVDPYEGPGSGPGYSLLSCAPHLNTPFYFVSCDTLWLNDLDLSVQENWFGVAAVEQAESKNYCNFEITDGIITGIKDKQLAAAPVHKAFVGLCFIKDHELFFKSLREKTAIAGEHQVSNGIRALVATGKARALDISWVDVGNSAQYQAAVAKFENFDFSKSDEFLYIVNGRVIKFFNDASITAKRVERARFKPAAFPAIESQQGQFYSYRFLNGETLYKHNSPALLKDLLKWLKQDFWTPAQVPAAEVEKVCHKFYYDKSMERLDMYRRKYNISDGQSRVNGTDIPSTAQLIERLPWNDLNQGVAVFVHGDLQFDNILYDPAQQKFILLDWRQDFAGQLNWGDLYYDLAKMLGGTILNYDLIKKNLLWYDEQEGEITIDFAQRFLSDDYGRVLAEFVRANGWDMNKVRTLTGLIYLNMAPLHHAPFDRMLYSLGRLMLWRQINEKSH